MMNIYFKALLILGGLYYLGSTTDEKTQLLSWQQSTGDLVDLSLFHTFIKF